MKNYLDLFHQGPVPMCMRVSERGTLMHRVLLIGEVQEPGPSDSVPNHSKGPSGALRVGHRTSRPITVHLILYRQDTNIFNLMGNIGGQDWGKEGVGRLRHSRKPTGGGDTQAKAGVIRATAPRLDHSGARRVGRRPQGQKGTNGQRRWKV